MIKRLFNRYGLLITCLFFLTSPHAAEQLALIELQIPLHFQGQDIFQLEISDVEKYWKASILTEDESMDADAYLDGINSCHAFQTKRKMIPFEMPKVIYALESYFVVNCAVLSELKKSKAVSTHAWDLNHLINVKSLKLPQCRKTSIGYEGIYSRWHPILKIKDLGMNQTIGLILIDYTGCGGTTYARTEVRKVVHDKKQNALYFAQE